MQQNPTPSVEDWIAQSTCAVIIDGQVKGTAWLFSDQGHLLTSGHILGKGAPLDQVEVRFSEDVSRTAYRVQRGYDYEAGVDYAILKLETPPSDRRPLPIELAETCEGDLMLLGYGKSLVDRGTGRGTFAGFFDPQDSPANRLFKLESTQLGEPGYSGGAVWSVEKQAVVAIQIEATTARTGAERDTVLAMPLYRIAHLWPALTQPAASKPYPQGKAPYRGLEYFDVQHAHLFFGREALTEKLLARLASNRFLAITGPSGSGKSSVARAGLLYRLQQGAGPDGAEVSGSAAWHVVTLTPTAKPLENLALNLRAVITELGPRGIKKELEIDEEGLYMLAREASSETRLLLFIDQFEEVFTLCHDEDARQDFLDNVLYAVGREDSPVRVVLTMRADFYGKCVGYPALAERLEQSQVLVGPMADDELRRAIEAPAERAGLELETGLVDQILDDVRAQPGSLPLLQYALRELWQAREDNCLTLQTYRSIGRVQGALAQRADAIYEAMTPGEKTHARDILLRLTRRRAPKSELVPAPDMAEGEGESMPESATAEDVLRRLADDRLITTSREQKKHHHGDQEQQAAAEHGQEKEQVWVDVAHEALIRGWPRLQSWLDDDREAIRTHRQITNAAREWKQHHYDSDYLFRGGRLAPIEAWLPDNEARLNPLEVRFVRESIETARRRRRRTIALVASAFAVITLLAMTAAIFGLRSNRQAQDLSQQAGELATAVLNAEEARQTAVAGEDAARASEAEAQRQTRLARARSLASQAASYRQSDPELALLLAMHAVSTTYASDSYTTLEASIVLRSLLVPQPETVAVLGHEILKSEQDGNINHAAYSPDGAYIVTASQDGCAQVWDAKTGSHFLTLKGHNSWVWSAAYSPDGQRIVTSSEDNTARVWNAETGEELLTLKGHTGGVEPAVYSPDGKQIATASEDGTLRVWDAETGSMLVKLSSPSSDVESVAYSPDGKHIVTAGEDGVARVWNMKTGKILLSLKGHTEAIWTAAYSPNGEQIVTASWDKTARVWDAETGKEILILGDQTNRIHSAAYSPDGAYIVTSNSNNTAQVWDAQTGEKIALLKGHTDNVNHAAFSPDGARIVTASNDNSAQVWNAQTGELIVRNIGIKNVHLATYSPDGAYIVTASDDGTARIWDAKTGEEIALLSGHTDSVNHAAYKPDGAQIVTASDDDTARIWDAKTGEEIALLLGHTDSVNHAAYKPGGAQIVTASDDGTARIWDAKTGEEIALLAKHTSPVNYVAYSPEGASIVTASDDNTAQIWNAQTGNDITALEGHMDSVNHVAYSSDGMHIITASDDNTARVWDAQTGEALTVLAGHTAPVNHVAYSPEGMRIVTTSDDKTARVWDAQTGEEIILLKGHTDNVNYVTYSPDGIYIVTASEDNTARVWKFSKPDRILLKHTSLVPRAVFSPDGRWVATAGQDENAPARIWDAATGVEVARLLGHGKAIMDDKEIKCPHCVNTIAFSPSGDRVVTAGCDGTARIWQVPDGKGLLTLEGHTGQLQDARFSPGGDVIATSSNADRTVRLWDAGRGKELCVLETISGTNSLDFSPDGRYVAAAGVQGNVWVWEVANGKKIAHLGGGKIELIYVAFSPDGQYLAAAGFGDTGFVWNLETSAHLATLEGHEAFDIGGLWGGIWQIVYSPNGKWIATAGQDGTARVWNANTGKEHFVLRGHELAVMSVAFSPDGDQVATGGMDGTVRLWNAQTGDLEAVLPDYRGTEFLINWELDYKTRMISSSGPLEWVYYVSYSPSGNRVVAAGADGTVNIYIADTEKLLGLAQEQVSRDLTCLERVRFLYENLDCTTEVTPTQTVENKQ